MDDLVNPVFQIFRPTVRDNSIESKEWLAYNAGSVTPAVTDTNFRIPLRDVETYQQISAGMIQVTGAIVDKDTGAVLPPTDRITMVANGFHLFSRMVLRAQGVDVERVQYPGYATTMTGLGECATDYTDSTGTAQMLMFDNKTGSTGTPAPTLTAVLGASMVGVTGNTHMLPLYPTGSVSTTENDGFDRRFALTQSIDGTHSRTFSLWLPLNRAFGFADSIKTVTRGIQWELELDLNRPEDYLYGVAGTSGKMLISTLQLWVPSYRPDITTALKLESGLKAGAVAVKDFHAYDCRIFDMPSAGGNAMTSSKSLAQTNKKVRRVFVGFKLKSRLQSFQANNALFDQIGLTSIQLRVGSHIHPRIPLRVVPGVDHARAYAGLLEACGNKHERFFDGAAVDIKTYQDLYPVYAFNLEEVDEKIFAGSADISIEFTHAAAAEYTIVSVVDTVQSVEIQAADSKMSLLF